MIEYKNVCHRDKDFVIEMGAVLSGMIAEADDKVR